MEYDAIGIPKRYAGERYMYKGRALTIIENQGLMVLCPCGDMLLVRYDDASDADEDVQLENTTELERIV